MADRAISDLDPVDTITPSDNFVLEHSLKAKRLTGQVLITWLLTTLDGHGGIYNIEKTSTSLNVDTYTITLADRTTYTFTVTNGTSIDNIEKSGTHGLVDTYTITLTDGSTESFDVTNGNGIDDIEKTSTIGLVDTYTITLLDGSENTFTVTNGTNIDTISKTSASGLVDTYTITLTDGTTNTFNVTNGNGIDDINKTSSVGLVDTYTISYTDGTYDTFNVTNGQSVYTWIMYSENEPTKDSDMHTTSDNWFGVYTGVSSTAPTHYTEYQWFQIKGEKGDDITVDHCETKYAVGDNGTDLPTTWYDYLPTVPPGKYLWVKSTVYFHPSGEATSYLPVRNGMDGGGGTVNSVNYVMPSPDGNVDLVRVEGRKLIIG